uniref:Cation/H+ exchanger domain-containing protein n=1 Tax=Globodera rostochiensis TaxID=31243 RepID=A0A914GXW8_GLORO
MLTNRSAITSRLNNILINVFNHRETNLVLSALLAFLCLYISLKSLLGHFEQQQFIALADFHNAHSAEHPNQLRSDHNQQSTLSSDHDHQKQTSSVSSDHDNQPTSSVSSDHVHQPSDHDHQPSDHDHQSSDHDLQKQTSYISSPKLSSPQLSVADHSPNLHSSAISLFVLWSLSLLVGRFLSYFFIPTLTGPIVVGILFANFNSVHSLLLHYSHQHQLSGFIYEFAFLLILVRSAFGIDRAALRQSFTLCCGLGLVCPLFDCLVTVLGAHFLFHLPLSTSILFAFALAPSSLAVITPIILCLKKEGRGAEMGISSTVLASAAIDNIVALTGFAITFGIVSPRSDVLAYTLTRMPAELLVGAIFGIVVGLLIRSVPRADSPSVHFVRTLLILSFAVAAHFGTRRIGCWLFGPVAVLLSTAVAKMRWEVDNSQNTRLEENALRLGWDLLVGPLLFLHLGMLLDLSTFARPMLGPSVALLALSFLSRFLSSLLFSMLFFYVSPSSDCVRQRLFLAFALLPKASLQCCLLPLVVQLSTNHPNSLLPVHVCLLSVPTAPVAQLLLRLVGRILLHPKLAMLSTVTATQLANNKMQIATAKVTTSDPKDNRLKLELGKSDESQRNRRQIHRQMPSFYGQQQLRL